MSSRDSIGGQVDARDLYKPSTPGGIRMAIRELRRQGLRARDISERLKLPLSLVIETLRDLESSSGN